MNRATLRPMQRAIAAVLAAAVTAAAVAGCASRAASEAERAEALRANMPELAEALFRPARPVPSAESLLALTDAQRRDFLRFFRSGLHARLPPHRRIHRYMDRHLSDIRFDHETASAAETIAHRRGNCMSLALVTTALADAGGVDIGWQLANTDPVYSSEGAVIYSANHIQSRLYEPRLGSTGHAFSLGRDYLLLDYFVDGLPEHGTPLARHQMLALVYQNLGVETLAEGELDRAFWLLREGVAHDPANANLYNALGVIHRRAGDAETAESLFRFALSAFGDRLIVLRNYRELLLAAGRESEAGLLQQRMLKLPDPDPYPMIQLGDEAHRAGDPGTALAYYRKANKVAPYLHEIHFRMARVHFELGQRARGEQQLEKARRKAWAESDKQRYQAKLQALSGGR